MIALFYVPREGILVSKHLSQKPVLDDSMEIEDTSGETTSLLQSRNSTQRNRPTSSRAIKYESIKLPPSDPQLPKYVIISLFYCNTYMTSCFTRFYVAKGDIWLTVILMVSIVVFAAVSITTGLPLLESKWQAYNEEQS